MRLGVGVLAAFVMMLGAAPVQAQARQVYVLEMDVADLRAEIMRIARDEAGEVSVELEPRERQVTSILSDTGKPQRSIYAPTEEERRARGLGRKRTIVGDTLEVETGRGVETPILIEGLQKNLPGFELSLRIDGTILARLTDDGLARRLLSAMVASEAIIERRLELAGISRPQVELRDGMRLEVSLSTRVAADVASLLTVRGAVSFHRVDIYHSPEEFEPGVAKDGLVALPDESRGGELQVIKLMPIIAAGEIASAKASFDEYGRPTIAFTLKGAARMKFAQATTEMIGLPFAIVADGVILSAPVVNSPITGGEGQISGVFTEQEAGLLAASISGGVLPARLVITEQGSAEPR